VEITRINIYQIEQLWKVLSEKRLIEEKNLFFFLLLLLLLTVDTKTSDYKFRRETKNKTKVVEDFEKKMEKYKRNEYEGADDGGKR
jgi:hypothetical protein